MDWNDSGWSSVFFYEICRGMMTTLPFREPYVFPPKKKKPNKTTNIKHLFIGLGLHLFVYSLIFGSLMYIREPKWLCMFIASFFGTATSLTYWGNNAFRETTCDSDNIVDNSST